MLIHRLMYAILRLRSRLRIPNTKYGASYGTTMDGREYYVRVEHKDNKWSCLDLDKVATIIDPRHARHIARGHLEE